MRVFVTGATGFIGSALTRELIAAGHQVLGLTRSDAGAQGLRAAGATPHPGSLEDLASLAAGAAQADAVVHLAFNHDFSRYQANCEDDRRAIETLGAAIEGSERPMLVTSGVMMARGAPGALATEDDPAAPSSEIPRAASEEAADALVARGVNAGVVRLPQVHDRAHHGLVTMAIQAAIEKRVSPWIGDGENRWAAAHISDVARLYRLALERAEPGVRYNAVGEEGVAMRDVAEAIGRRLGLPARSITPEEAPAHFGFLAMFAGGDRPASSARTQARLGWTPTGPGLIADIDQLKLAAA